VNEDSPKAAEWQRVSELWLDSVAWQSWQSKYRQRLAALDTRQSQKLMRSVNPKYILRNHLAESAIQKSKMGDHSEVETLFKLLQSPFDDQMSFDHYANLPPDWASSIEISCSS
jgi:uncharacterized protein YdiU (UPF0061 family)